MLTKEEYIKNWAEKLSLTTDEIESEFNKLLRDEKIIHTNLNEEQQNQRALQRLALTYKKQLRSPAVGFEGIIIGVSDCVDIVARKKREALELFRTDPVSAVGEGITNEDGIPLDDRKSWANGRPNNSYGKPLPEHNYMKNVFGIVVKSKLKDEPRYFSMVINGEKAADDNIPVFKPVRFMAIDRTSPEAGTTLYQLNASSFTTFNIDKKLQLPNHKEMITKYQGITKISELQAHHDANKTNFNRIVVVEGDVSTLRMEPISTGNRIMTIESADSLEDLDAKGLTCWMPPRINIDFAEGSKVLVVGRTGQGKVKDPATGQATEELSDITLNAFGVYPIPEYKIDLPDDIKPLKEDDLSLE